MKDNIYHSFGPLNLYNIKILDENFHIFLKNENFALSVMKFNFFRNHNDSESNPSSISNQNVNSNLLKNLLMKYCFSSQYVLSKKINRRRRLYLNLNLIFNRDDIYENNSQEKNSDYAKLLLPNLKYDCQLGVNGFLIVRDNLRNKFNLKITQNNIAFQSITYYIQSILMKRDLSFVFDTELDLSKNHCKISFPSLIAYRLPRSNLHLLLFTNFIFKENWKLIKSPPIRFGFNYKFYLRDQKWKYLSLLFPEMEIETQADLDLKMLFNKNYKFQIAQRIEIPSIFKYIYILKNNFNFKNSLEFFISNKISARFSLGVNLKRLLTLNDYRRKLKFGGFLEISPSSFNF